jgi:bacillithiol synthase
MQTECFKRNQLPFSGKLIELFSEQQASLHPLIGLPFSAENFEKQIELKSGFSKENRLVLKSAIEQQYSYSTLTVPNHIEALLEDNCFTVCTGHQLNLFTGPLYTIYKIAHTIKLAQEVQERYPKYRILPIFWMASEDHDLEEINHFHVGAKKIQWSTKQSGPVGAMKLDNWSEWQTELLALFPNQKDKIKKLLEIYQGENLSFATRRLIAHLFEGTEIIIVDGNDKALKSLFAPIICKEIQEQFSYKASLISDTILKEKNLKAQAFAREINLFHLSEQARIRIEPTTEEFKIGTQHYSASELLELVNKNPEQFSPNVMLRPLYQETILPNLCYVGGAGELAYWLQLKPIFDAANVPYPMIQLRVSMQLMTQKEAAKIEKLKFKFPQFADKKERVLKEHLVAIRERVDKRDDLLQSLNELEKIMLDQAKSVDETLIAAAAAERARIDKLLNNFIKKLERNEKLLHQDALFRVQKLHEKLFPNDGLQERHESFISFYLDTNEELIPEVIQKIEAFSSDFAVGVI